MKTLYITLVSLLLTVLLGCQENSVTDPVTEGSSLKLQNSDLKNVNHGIIPLQGVLRDPHPLINSFYQISGQIEYYHTLYYLDPIPPAAQYSVFLSYTVQADLRYLCTLNPLCEEDVINGFISTKSEASVLIFEEFSVLEASFPIQGCKNGMLLNVRFLVKTNSLELNAMWLALPNTNSVATEINHY